jgi:hypothetical protein
VVAKRGKKMKNLYICELEFLSVLFPDYQIVRSCEYVKKDWIYAGNLDIPGDMEALCVSPFLNKNVNISLPDNVAIVRFAYGRKGIQTVPGQVIKHVESLQDKLILMRELKRFMATGKWENFCDVDTKVYKMFAALTEDNRQFLNQYFILRETYSFEHVWESILTFFRRVVDTKADLSNFTSFYQKQIEAIRAYKDQIAKIMSIFSRNHFNETILLSFILDLRLH